MHLVEAVRNSFSLLESLLPLLRGLPLSTYLLLAVRFAFIWLMVRTSSAIIGEYGKRFWFKYIHRPGIRQSKVALQHVEAEQATAREELAALRYAVKRLDEQAQEAAEMLAGAAQYFRSAGMPEKAAYYEAMARRLGNRPANDSDKNLPKSA